MTGDIERLLAVDRPRLDRRRRRRHPGHRPRTGRTSRRGAPRAARDAPGAPRDSGVSAVDRLPDGLARSPPRGHARRPVRARARSRFRTIRKRSSRRDGCSATSASTNRGSPICSARSPRATSWPPTLVAAPRLRRAAGRSRVPGAAGGSGSGPPAGAGGVPRGRRRATARPLNAGPALATRARAAAETRTT